MAATKKPAWRDVLGSTGTPAEDAEVPKEPPATVYMHTIVGNPDNPRAEEDYTDDDAEFRELKASMKEIGQLQPLAVVSRHVYEQAKPDAVAKAPAKTSKAIQEADWVVVTGNRRLAAARQLGWTRIDIRVQDQLGDEDGRIDEAVIIENIHRKNLAPIREAEYLAGMVKRHGSQEKVAERIGKSQMFVSQRLALLNLAPDLREEVDAGTLKIKAARQVARTADHEEQRARVAELKAKTAEPKPTAGPDPVPVQNRVLKPAPEPVVVPSTGSVQNRVLNGAPAVDPERAESIPEPRSDVSPTVEGAEGVERPLKRFPYEDGFSAAQHLIRKMPPAELEKVTDLLNEHRAKQAAGAR